MIKAVNLNVYSSGDIGRVVSDYLREHPWYQYVDLKISTTTLSNGRLHIVVVLVYRDTSAVEG
jgi:hypothetical protein